ncbi:hypothetical protein AUR64_14250 [Haloprofundus marisrubri]|uniref:Uncharacterized protein n=1 Tax=Haloprofundus marisrubri TaxID=1514971 RepID=A0A0W1R647_9EURY|nr:hypothetical protein [Haloprofundus marisrubri]KTG08966.1 hypothetical protein AUR64_14250 [Haloprofundus marisrubri]
MVTWRDPVVLVLSCFLLTAVVSGPVVAGVDLTPEDRVDDDSSTFTGATGSVTVSETTIPSERYTLRQGVTGSGIHKLDAPMSTVSVETTSGPVLVMYSLRVPELSYDTEVFRTVDEGFSGELTVGLDDASVPSNRLENDTYRATVEISVREESGKRVLDQREITIVVA